MKKTLILALAFAMITALMSCSAGNTVKLNQTKKTYIFVTEEYPPYEYINVDDEFDGSDVKIIEAAAKLAGVQVVFKMMPWAECNKMVDTGMADGIFSLSASDERKSTLRFPKINLSIEKIAIFTNPGFKKEIAKLSDLNGMMIGVVEDYAYTEDFDNFSGCQKVKFASVNHLVKGLIDGKVPMIIASEETAKYYIDMYKSVFSAKKDLISQITLQPYKPGIEPLYLGISKATPNCDDTYRTFNDALLLLQENGEMLKIKKRYLK